MACLPRRLAVAPVLRGRRGPPLATLEFGLWSEHGAIVLDGERLRIVREGLWHQKFHLEGRRGRLATGQAAGAFRLRFRIAHGDEEYRLDPASFFLCSFDLRQRGRSLGQIRTAGLFSRRFQIELDAELAPELRLFAFWLILLARRRGALKTRLAVAGPQVPLWP